MRAEIIKPRQRINTSFIYFTHDRAEPIKLGIRSVHITLGTSGVNAKVDVSKMMGYSVYLHVVAVGQNVVVVVNTMDMIGTEESELKGGRKEFGSNNCHAFNMETGTSLEAE